MQLTHANSLMRECLGRLQAQWSQGTAGLDGDALRFAHLLMTDVVPHRGCYVLRRSLDDAGVDPEGTSAPGGEIANRSSYEDFANHVNVSEFVQVDAPNIAVLGVGLALADMLSLRLRITFPTVRFRVMVSFRGRPLGPDDADFMRDCRVSFHAVRAGEVVLGDLEHFKYEAVGIIEV